MTGSFLKNLVLLVTLIPGISGRLLAQHSPARPDTTAEIRRGPAKMDAMEMSGADDAWRMAAMARHMAYSSVRPLTASDSIRAMRVVSDLRQAIAKYQDVRVAEADGYRMFAPRIKNQPQYHFTKNWNAIRNQFGFDPARPTSLLYKKDAEGRFHLIGAMYTASKRASEEDLNERIPLSVARWHRHINWCMPPRSHPEMWSRTMKGRPVFGPLGVATEGECREAGGRFIPQVFGWMVHANVFAGNDLKSIWHDDHMMDHDHAMLGEPNSPR